MTPVFARRRSPVRVRRVIVAPSASLTGHARVRPAPIDRRVHSRDAAPPRSHVHTTDLLAPRPSRRAHAR
jgi:hypothetical protein